MINVEVKKHENRLLAAVREDIAAHERILEILAEQEASVRRPADERFQEATAALERELSRVPQRKIRRDRALKGLAEHFGVAASALTIGSIVERLREAPGEGLGEGLGDDDSALARDRERLRELAIEVKRSNRRVATLVRIHRQVTRELIQVVLGPSDGSDVHAGGSLIDAEV